MNNSIENLLDVVSDRQNRMCVKGTATTVHRIARWWRTGMTADDIAADYEHLTLAGVHAALAYYFINRERIDAEIEADIMQERRIISEHSYHKRMPEMEAA